MSYGFPTGNLTRYPSFPSRFSIQPTQFFRSGANTQSVGIYQQLYNQAIQATSFYYPASYYPQYAGYANQFFSSQPVAYQKPMSNTLTYPSVVVKPPSSHTPSSGVVTKPLDSTLKPVDNPLKWDMYTKDKKDLYPAEAPSEVNTSFFSLGIGINNTKNNPLQNPIFDLMNFNRFFCHDACGIPIDNAVVMAGCLKERQYEPLQVNMEREIKHVVEKANSDPHGVYFVLFSSHGAAVPGGTEADGKQEVIISQDLKYITDESLVQELGVKLQEGREGYAVLDLCHSGGQNWPYVVRANEMQVVQNDEATHADLSHSGRSVVFMTSLKTETSADGPVGQGGAGSQALRYALVKHGMSATFEDVIKTSQGYLKEHGYSQHVSIMSSHPFKMTDTYFSEATIQKMKKLERAVQGPGSRSIDAVSPAWQQVLVLQAKIEQLEVV